MTHAAQVAVDTPLTARVRYQIEEDWDYAYLEATSDGTTWTPLKTNRYPRDQPAQPEPGLRHHRDHQHPVGGPDGDGPGRDDGDPVPLLDRPEHQRAGLLRRQHRARWSDRSAPPRRPTRAGRSPPSTSGGTEARVGADVRSHPADAGRHDVQALLHRRVPPARRLRRVAEDGVQLRVHRRTPNRPDKAEHYPYQEGLLVWYWDTQYSDNNVGDHPGHGELLPVDAHPRFSHWPNGTLMRNRILSYDSTFGLSVGRTRSRSTTTGGRETTVERRKRPGQYVRRHQAVVVPEPTSTRSTASTRVATSRGWYSVDVPKTGTTIKVTDVRKRGDELKLKVN